MVNMLTVDKEPEPLNKFLKNWMKKHLAKSERFAEIFYLDIYRSNQAGAYPLALLVTAQNLYEFSLGAGGVEKSVAQDAENARLFLERTEKAQNSASLLVKGAELQIAQYAWREFSQAKWDAQSQSLTFYLRDRESFSSLVYPEQKVKQLGYSSLVGPELNFMNCVNEGISATVVYSAPLNLPSGLEITAQILRDGKRKFSVFPEADWLPDSLDQRFLRERYSAWEEELGLKL